MRNLISISFASPWQEYKRNRLGERRQLYQVAVEARAPAVGRPFSTRPTADDNERVESLFSQLQRHPGAGRFACSSAVEINVLVFRERLEFLGKIIRLDAHGSLDTLAMPAS